jgi:hypothetical protein
MFGSNSTNMWLSPTAAAGLRGSTSARARELSKTLPEATLAPAAILRKRRLLVRNLFTRSPQKVS